MNRRIAALAVCIFCVGVAFNACEKEDAPDVDCATISGATYSNKVHGIIDQYCVSCHSVGGSAQDEGLMNTYALAKAQGDHIYEHAVLEKSMPPDEALPDSAIYVLHCWREAGFPEN